MPFTLSGLSIYPIKSCAPVLLDEAAVEARGLAHDRRWLIVDDMGKFITGRQNPRTVLIRATPTAAGVRLSAPDMPELDVLAPEGNAERLAVDVWKDRIDAAVAHPEADAWVTRFLGRGARLVFMDRYAERAVSPEYGRAEDRVSFADAFPMLLISQAALDALNDKLAAPIPMLRFRPNLVVSGTTPHAEDGWRRIRVGNVEFDVVKPCTRCVFTTVDPQHGEFDRSGEPLATLKHYRRSPGGITFGQNLIPRSPGMLHRGDKIEVLEQRL